jgi:hypothetical protein
MSANWQDDWSKGVDAFGRDLIGDLQQIFQDAAPEIEAHLKETAPWPDQSGASRQALHAEAKAESDGASVTFGHGVDYGLDLELKEDGKYAVVLPTMDTFAIKLFGRVIERIK